MPVGSRQFPLLILLSLALTSILCPSIALACKDRIYPPTFPTVELQAFEHVYVIRVDQLMYAASSEDSRYSKPFSFEGKVVRVIKGTKVAGDAIRAATTSDEEAHARCPISLESGKTYLLMLNGSGLTYRLPRYGSLYIATDRPEFGRYLADLTKKSR
ncbi:hypothetical protein [Duganella radicis]|uniref:Uncharacterized protein n=1 Tax=Duganella radicis TaxID=551988 RepID=A0A6L6PIS2_9BURK|nr:hypothetical protein [Duganella radicis]MTV38457.1 hypothetical protein [Duganella radicis]